jgi:transcriptional regulator with XRE-family HTH domain
MEKTIASKEYRVLLRQLRTARVTVGLTQQQLADRLGETQSFISKVERGERRLDVVELRAFCEALGLSFPTFATSLHHALSRGKKPLCKQR